MKFVSFCEEWGLIPGEEDLDEVGSVGAEVIRVAADYLPLDGQRKEDGAFGNWRNEGFVRDY